MRDEHHLAPAVDFDKRLDATLQDGEVVVAPLCAYVCLCGRVCEPPRLTSEARKCRHARKTDLHVVQREAPIVGGEDEVAVVVPDRRKIPYETGPDLLWYDACVHAESSAASPSHPSTMPINLNTSDTPTHPEEGPEEVIRRLEPLRRPNAYARRIEPCFGIERHVLSPAIWL